jgi:signal peptidase I
MSKINLSTCLPWLKECLYRFFIVLAGILLTIILRVFFFATYLIPTPSMEPAIIPGDKVLVNKLIPGPRIIRNFFSLHKGEKPDIIHLKDTLTIRHKMSLSSIFPILPGVSWDRI